MKNRFLFFIELVVTIVFITPISIPYWIITGTSLLSKSMEALQDKYPDFMP